MEFTRDDIQRLYGRVFFMLPEAEAPAREAVLPPADPAWLSGGPAVNWKMKPQARLALILSQAEFNDRTLTGQLKKWVEAAQVPTDLIGFGVVDSAGLPVDVRKMPVNTGILFFEAPSSASPSLQVGGKDFFLAGTLSQGVQGAGEPTRVIQALQQAKFLINA